MKPAALARKTHQWLALLFGLQLLVWSLTGLYMVAIHIDIIHGDHLVREQSRPSVSASLLTDPLAAAALAGARSVRLTTVRGRPAYVLDESRVVDAMTAEPLAKPTEAEVGATATALYTGDEAIISSRLLTDIPGEIRGRKPPLWRVEFDHWNKPTFYISPITGELVTRRHELWRIFDFAWMLHIMDYETRDNVNNWLLILFSAGALLTMLTGAWMLVYAFPKRRKATRP